MGTSASANGAGNQNPLIPSWIPGAPPAPEIPPPDNDANSDNNANNSEGRIEGDAGGAGTVAANGSRFTGPRKNFNKYVRSGGNNNRALKRALKEYSKNAAGGTSGMAKRMRPSVFRVTSFFTTINTVKDNGKRSALAQFNLSSYQDKPLFEILSSLSDEIFKDSGRNYEDTQDDSITRQAYSNTVVRICNLEGIDLDNLNNQQVEIMMSIFIEETIAQRVIVDIGNMFMKTNPDIEKLLEMEENIYQIISGLVRNKIMPEIIATQIGDKANIELKIENIYRQAFDAIKETNE